MRQRGSDSQSMTSDTHCQNFVFHSGVVNGDHTAVAELQLHATASHIERTCNQLFHLLCLPPAGVYTQHIARIALFSIEYSELTP